jgi:hypothetical protein
MYVDYEAGFVACYPTNWVVVTQREGADSDLTKVTFSPAAGAAGAGLRYVSVTTTPALEDFTDEEFLQEINNLLREEYYRRLLAEPRFVTVDQRRAVDAAYEARVVLGRQVVDLTRWVTAFRANDRRWFIDFAGRTESRGELERIRAQFLVHFRVLPELAQN